MPTMPIRHWLMALFSSGVLWTQLVLIPLVFTWAQGQRPHASAIVAGSLVLFVAVMGVRWAGFRPMAGVATVLVGVPAALAAFALTTDVGSKTRFDAPAQVIAAATAVGFMVATAAWSGSLSPRLPTTVSPLEPMPSRPASRPWRTMALASLVFTAAIVTVVAPAWIASEQTLTRSERLAGQGFLHARQAITAAGGLAIGLALVLVGGHSLVRRRTALRRNTARALLCLVWGAAVLGLRSLLERLR